MAESDPTAALAKAAAKARIQPGHAMLDAIVAALGGAGSFGATYTNVDNLRDQITELKAEVKGLRNDFAQMHAQDIRITRLETLVIEHQNREKKP